MLDEKLDAYLMLYVRRELRPFKISDVIHFLRESGIAVSSAEIKSLLDTHPYVFHLSKKEYITRAGCFTGRVFSIKPTKLEIDNGILIPGDRFMPFSDMEMLPNELSLIYNGNIVLQKTGTYPLTELMSHYQLYGEEYAAQFLAMDPCNRETDYSANDFMLPAKLDLTVYDFSRIYEESGFVYGDRLVFTLMDWDQGVFSVKALCERKDNPFEKSEYEKLRSKWFSVFEKALKNSFEMNGPGSSIEEQLAMTYLYAMKELSVPYCGSIEEFLQKSKTIAITDYGVESRLWIVGEQIPAVGNWSKSEDVEKYSDNTLYKIIGLPIADSIVNAFIMDSLYRDETDASSVLPRIIKKPTILNRMQEEMFLLHLHRLHDIIRKSYNKFADYKIGKIRQDTLSFYSDLLMIICELDRCTDAVANMPQQELVILSQLFGHTSKLIESLLFQPNVTDKDLSTFRLSLEGMEFSFGEIRKPLEAVIKKDRMNGFSISRNKG